jgi:hypothetical protein
MASAEQICSHDPSRAYRHHLKRKAARLWRRAAKRDPENAPVKRPVRGWSL